MAALSGSNPKTLLELVIKTFSQNSPVCGTIIFELNNVSSYPARRGEGCCHLVCVQGCCHILPFLGPRKGGSFAGFTLNNP